MKKHKETYTPQFDFDNIQEQQLEIKTCKGCGKTGAYLGLDSNGLCFYCRENEAPSKQYVLNSASYPDFEKFNKYCDKKIGFDVKYRFESLFWFWLFGAFYSTRFFLFESVVTIVNIFFILLSFMIIYLNVVLGITLLIFFAVAEIIFFKTIPHHRKNEFDKFNRMICHIGNDEWLCPNCKNSNIGKCHCERCGVLPKFKEK